MSELLRAGLEVALPAHDRGVVLIAYADLSSKVRSFIAVPIQMKAASTRSFSAVADAMGWTKTPSWQRGGYTTSNPGKKLCQLLEPHRMSSALWWSKVAGAVATEG